MPHSTFFWLRGDFLTSRERSISGSHLTVFPNPNERPLNLLRVAGASILDHGCLVLTLFWLGRALFKVHKEGPALTKTALERGTQV